MSKKVIIANWKVNPPSVKEAVLLAQKTEREISKSRNVEVIIAPPFPFLAAVGGVLKKSKLGAQDAFWTDGPYTGEVSPTQLKNIGAKYIILGHSERKIHLGETDSLINKKVHAVLESGLGAILCVGERERVGSEIPQIVGEQLKNALKNTKTGLVKNLVVVYEPIWAISTMPGAKSDTPDSAFRALLYIRRVLSELYGRRTADTIRILYGGSVNSANAGGFIHEGKMQGALVGGASLKPKEFALIVREVSR
ncbi:MAG: triose-phosphate isomerase [Candidatus Sungiibacteriota bacterium]|uniref:Triosephosphate isomerase n=1 Tax=Candidatus Sungiibacteriota bacterium TaxID=2750080 RepID=A0A7T5URX2_9BACT|nr:MAG: triose-phosphate isomerase [Candidatus Sungbacteria bacterium]